MRRRRASPRTARCDPVGVVTGDDQDLSGGVRADPERVDESRRESTGQFGEERLVLPDLDVQRLPAPGHRSQGVLGRSERASTAPGAVLRSGR